MPPLDPVYKVLRYDPDISINLYSQTKKIENKIRDLYFYTEFCKLFNKLESGVYIFTFLFESYVVHTNMHRIYILDTQTIPNKIKISDSKYLNIGYVK